MLFSIATNWYSIEPHSDFILCIHVLKFLSFNTNILSISALYHFHLIRVNNANVSKCDRDVAEVKKKWQDLSSQTKKKEAMRIRHRQATGGGPAIEDDLKSWETLVE